MSPWVRIDEKAMEHPKVAGLSGDAFKLWVQGLSHCQKFLTDGAIDRVSLRGLRSYSGKRAAELVEARLWVPDEAGGVTVHDYLDWNESKAHVLKVRAQGRERIKRLRGRNAGSNAVTPHEQRANAMGDVLCVSELASSEAEGGKGGNPLAKVAFEGSRLKVWRWQHEDLARRLGDREFDLIGWYPRLNAELERTGESYADPWRWLQERLYADADLPLPNLFGREKRPHKPAQMPRRQHWSDECAELHGGTCRNQYSHSERLADEKAAAS